VTLVDERDPDTFAIIGAAMAVHGALGCGFLEPVYQEALAVELGDRGISHVREHPVKIIYKGRELRSIYRADFVCLDTIIVETKAQRVLTSRDESQVIHYLKALRIHRALLINFGSEQLEFRRFALDRC
jgi:GxxExxY protein